MLLPWLTWLACAGPGPGDGGTGTQTGDGGTPTTTEPEPTCGKGVAALLAGQPHADLQAALDAAGDDASITVCRGQHAVRLGRIGGRLALAGATGEPTAVVLVPAEPGPILRVEAGGLLELSALSLAGAEGEEGAAVLVLDAALVLDGVVVRDHISTVGGAVALVSSKDQVSTLEARDSSFSANGTAGSGAAVRTSGEGAVTVVLDGVDFARNSADQQGGAIALEHRGGGAVSIDGGTLSTNQSGLAGGALLVAADDTEVVLTDVVLDSNLGGTSGGGVAISGTAWASSVILSGCELRDNVAARDGGGLWWVPNSTGLEVRDSVLEGNLAGISGGAIYSTTWEQPGDLLLAGSTLSDNGAAERGGAVAVLGTSEGQLLTIEDCSLDANTAVEGGALYASILDETGATLAITGSSLVGNSAVVDGNGDGGAGGAVRLKVQAGGMVTLSDSVLSDNVAASGGGALSLQAQGEVSFSFDGSTLSGNSADLGGAVVVDGDADGGAVLSLASCAVTGNSDTTAAVYLSEVALESSDTDWGEGDDDNSPADLATLTELHDDLGADESFSCSADGSCTW